ncbi:conserved Plasmodium protein, unknown function [Plasmodium malariae]|uniref:Uncharacterized protein n=1 Tax=Plasmodium malariae TaxID=5858 RepID=A0A1C3KE90_PLAMA|nr:conserved Plasmodium protein, unknown function [Plasmodium malariae]
MKAKKKSAKKSKLEVSNNLINEYYNIIPNIEIEIENLLKTFHVKKYDYKIIHFLIDIIQNETLKILRNAKSIKERINHKNLSIHDEPNNNIINNDENNYDDQRKNSTTFDQSKKRASFDKSSSTVNLKICNIKCDDKWNDRKDGEQEKDAEREGKNKGEKNDVMNDPNYSEEKENVHKCAASGSSSIRNSSNCNEDHNDGDCNRRNVEKVVKGDVGVEGGVKEDDGAGIEAGVDVNVRVHTGVNVDYNEGIDWEGKKSQDCINNANAKVNIIKHKQSQEKLNLPESSTIEAVNTKEGEEGNKDIRQEIETSENNKNEGNLENSKELQNEASTVQLQNDENNYGIFKKISSYFTKKNKVEEEALNNVEQINLSGIFSNGDDNNLNNLLCENNNELINIGKLNTQEEMDQKSVEEFVRSDKERSAHDEMVNEKGENDNMLNERVSSDTVIGTNAMNDENKTVNNTTDEKMNNEVIDEKEKTTNEENNVKNANDEIIENNVNSNMNSNVNSNMNSNVNSNMNSNVNSNVNSNMNSNVNSNMNSNVNSNMNSNMNSNVNSNMNSNINSNMNGNNKDKIPYEEKEDNKNGSISMAKHNNVNEKTTQNNDKDGIKKESVNNINEQVLIIDEVSVNLAIKEYVLKYIYRKKNDDFLFDELAYQTKDTNNIIIDRNVKYPSGFPPYLPDDCSINTVLPSWNIKYNFNSAKKKSYI